VRRKRWVRATARKTVSKSKHPKDHQSLTKQAIGTAVSVAIDTAAVEQHHGVVSRVIGHPSLNLTTKSTSTGAVVTDARLVILISIRIIIVVHNEPGVGVHKQTGQQGPIRTNGLLTPPRSLNNGTMVSSHTLGRGDASRIERTSIGSGMAVPTGHQVRGRQGASAAVQVFEQCLGIFLSQKLVKGAGGVNAVPLIIAFGGVAELVSKRLDVRAVAGRDSFGLVLIGDVVESAEDTIDEVSRKVLMEK
jgi:hypothetical protein